MSTSYVIFQVKPEAEQLSESKKPRAVFNSWETQAEVEDRNKGVIKTFALSTLRMMAVLMAELCCRIASNTKLLKKSHLQHQDTPTLL